ncbi:hypothetical protein PTKIN_Ptkin09bG0199600 [Pterospermum kingtungense]
MSGYPYYSPQPPPPPPKCNHTIPPPPPTPPKCNHSISPPPPPPPPPPPKCTPCPCVCPPITQPPTAPPPYWPSPPPITPVPQGPQPPPSPGPPDHVVIIAVFVSLGGVFFLAFLAVGLLCLAKKKKKMIPPPAAAAACVEEHQHIQETITTGPCGEQTVTVTIDDDVRIHEAAEVGAAVDSCHVEPPDSDRPSIPQSEGHL